MRGRLTIPFYAGKNGNKPSNLVTSSGFASSALAYSGEFEAERSLVLKGHGRTILVTPRGRTPALFRCIRPRQNPETP